MYKLIEKQQEDVAFKVLQTVPKNNLNPSKKGNFFLKTLINFNTVSYISNFWYTISFS